MGKPYGGHVTPVAESASAISLRTQESPDLVAAPAPPMGRYFDDDPAQIDDDDLPPLYSDHDHDEPVNPLLPAGAGPVLIQPFKRDAATGAEYYIDSRLDTDPVFLKDHLERLALEPPRPYVHIRGTHTDSQHRGSDGKKERREIVDFDIQIELTHLLYQDIVAREPLAREMVTAGPFDKVRRGTVFATRAPGFGGSGAPEDGLPGLDEWCRRFCASRAGLKCFTLQREVLGWDDDGLRAKLESLVRSTNYRGSLRVEFPIQNSRVDVYNDCRTSRWRLTRWIEVVFTLTLLFVFTWPWLFFRTARWEVASVRWHMSVAEDGSNRRRYASLSEDRWYNMWARPIHRAVLARRQGMLDQADLEGVDAPPAEGFAGAVQQGVEAMGLVNRSFGWGGSS